jgi:hypothetical protein
VSRLSCMLVQKNPRTAVAIAVTPLIITGGVAAVLEARMLMTLGSPLRKLKRTADSAVFGQLQSIATSGFGPIHATNRRREPGRRILGGSSADLRQR